MSLVFGGQALLVRATELHEAGQCASVRSGIAVAVSEFEAKMRAQLQGYAADAYRVLNEQD